MDGLTTLTDAHVTGYLYRVGHSYPIEVPRVSRESSREFRRRIRRISFLGGQASEEQRPSGTNLWIGQLLNMPRGLWSLKNCFPYLDSVELIDRSMYSAARDQRPSYSATKFLKDSNWVAAAWYLSARLHALTHRSTCDARPWTVDLGLLFEYNISGKQQKHSVFDA